MSEEIVKEVEQSLPPYIGVEQLEDEYEHLRVINLAIDALNNKKVFSLEMFITDTAQVIPGLPEYGAFIVCVQGGDSAMPGGVYAYSSNGAAGTVAALAAQNGSGDWNVALTFAASGGNVTVKHALASTAGKFYITVLGYF